MKKSHDGDRKPGRPSRMFDDSVRISLWLPIRFREVLDEIGGSHSEAFVQAINDDKLLRKLRKTLKT